MESNFGASIKFSILIPVYNVEKYIEECLDSVLCQSYDNFEVILVDDGSTDSSGKICDEYAEKYSRIKVIHQNNKGQLFSRCAAIKASVGDYCLFLDADDLFVENIFETLNNLIKEYDCPDMIIFPFYYERESKLKKSKTIVDNNVLYENETLKEVYKNFFATTILNSVCTKAIKRSVALESIADIEKYKNLRCAEDRIQSARMIDASARILYTDNPLYRYRLFDESTTRTYLPSAISRFNTKVIYEEEKYYLKKWEIYSADMIDIFNAGWFSYVIYVFELFYDNCKKKDKNKILRYPWLDFIPNEINNENTICDNVRLNKHTDKLIYLIKNEKYFSIKLFLLKKNIYKKLRDFKRKIINKG